MKKIRVLVVEDSLTVRKRIVEAMDGHPQLEVVGEAADGKVGIEMCEALRPDVVSLDMMLPVMTGLAATEYIMAYCPTPILIVSASTNRGEVFRTYDALAAGAIDVLDKPESDEPDAEWDRRYLNTLVLISRIKVITHPRARLASPRVEPGTPRPTATVAIAEVAPLVADTLPRIVVIGVPAGPRRRPAPRRGRRPGPG
jgi:two-component system chemotaxis response regulator CheB